MFLQRTILFIFAIGALVALNLIWMIPTIRATYVSASILALETVERARADVNFSLATVQRGLEEAAAEIAFEPSRKKIALERILKYNPPIRSIGVVDQTGKETFLLDRFRFVTPADLHNYATTTYFQLARQGTANFGDVFVSPESEPHMVLAVPIALGTAVKEVLIADVNIRDLVSAIHTPKIKEGHIYVVDKKGDQIIHPNLSELLRRPNFFERPIVRKVIETREVADGLGADDTYTNEQNQATFTVGMPVSVANLSIFFEQPRATALAGVRQVVLFAAITVLLGAIILFMFIQGNSRLQRLNARLNELLEENHLSSKMLVRRDIELTGANARLQELDRTKSEFVSVAAHQLRTPLTGLRWSCHALLEDASAKTLSEEQKKIVEHALAATLQMITLINDLLNVARIEEGRFGFVFRPGSLVEVVQAAAPHFAELAEEKGVRLSVILPTGALPRIMMDAEKMKIVIDNLLDNAVKYTSPGGSVTLSVQQEQNELHVVVTDTGIGIPGEQLHKLFSKFFRAGNAMLFQTAGNGLGLYVVRNIVENHKGTMSVQSTEGKGSTFSFSVPIRSSA